MIRTMARHVLGGLLIACSVAGVCAATDHAECSHLVMLHFPGVTVTEAVDVPAKATGTIAVAHGRVSGVYSPTVVRGETIYPARPFAGPHHGARDHERRRHAHASALSVSAARGVLGPGQHGQRREFCL
jgi:hypothetical protein